MDTFDTTIVVIGKEGEEREGADRPSRVRAVRVTRAAIFATKVLFRYYWWIYNLFSASTLSELTLNLVL